MAISIGGALANFALNYMLIHGWFGLPPLGLAGIGLVTALVMSAMAALLAWHVTRHPAYAAYSLRHGLLHPRLDDLRELLRLGLPIGGTYAVESGLFAFAALCMGALGSLSLAAQIAIMSVYVAFMVPVGISYAVTFRIGQHFGAGRLEDARRAGRLGIAVGAGCMLSFAALFWLAPEWVVGLFLDRTAGEYQEVVALAVSLLAIAALFELFDGIQTIAMGAIRGLKDAKTTFLVGLGCYWLVGAPAAWLLAFRSAWAPRACGGAGFGACAAVGLTLGFEWKTLRMLRPQVPLAGACKAPEARQVAQQRLAHAEHQKAREVGQWQRLADPVALHLVAAELAQQGQLLGGLDAFGHHFQVEVVRQVDHRAHQLAVLGTILHAADEALVDLQQGDGQAVEVDEGGEAGAEVVQGETHADLAQGLHGLLHLLAAAHDRRLGEFELEPLGVDAALADQAVEGRQQLAVLELAEGQVHRHVQRRQARPRSHCMSRRAREMTQ